MARKMSAQDWTIGLVLAYVAVTSGLIGGIVDETQAISDVEGNVCSEDNDCPCYSADGIGISSCNNGACDTVACVDVQPFKDWIKENPKQWISNNPGLFFGIVALLGYMVYTFK